MAINKISKADLFIIAGTSLKVYPASGLINYYNGENVVLINKEHLYLGNSLTLEINKPVGEVFKLVDNLSR